MQPTTLLFFTFHPSQRYKDLTGLSTSTAEENLRVLENGVLITPPGRAMELVEFFPREVKAYAWVMKDETWTETRTLEPGRGYFIRGDSGPVSLPQNRPMAGSWEFHLARGWNIVDNPFTEGVPLSQVTVTSGGRTLSWREAARKGWVADRLSTFRENTCYVSSPSANDLQLPPLLGLHLLSTVDAVLKIEPAPAKENTER